MAAFSPRLLCLIDIGRLRGRRFDSANGAKEEVMDISVLDNKQALEKLYDGNTTFEIGEMIGTNQERVRLALHKHKIPVRKKGARTERDKVERAICRLRNILKE